MSCSCGRSRPRRGCFALGRLCRLQGAGARSWRCDPTGFLSGACPAQIRRGVQDDAIAVRSRGDRTPAGGVRHRDRDPRLPRRAAARSPSRQGRAAHGGAEGTADLNARPAVLTVAAGRSHQLCAQSLGRADAVPRRRACRGRHQYGRAFNAPDCDGPPQLTVQRQRRRRRELGDPGIAGQHGKAPRTRSAGLFDRRAGADRFRANQKPSTARTPGLELEGCPRAYRTGRRMSRRRHPALSATTVDAMSLAELERWLRDRAGRRPVATSIATLDGYVAAIVAGPVSISPLDWICPLLAIDADAFNHGGTPEFAAISAAAQYHNAISTSPPTRIGSNRSTSASRTATSMSVPGVWDGIPAGWAA